MRKRRKSVARAEKRVTLGHQSRRNPKPAPLIACPFPSAGIILAMAKAEARVKPTNTSHPIPQIKIRVILCPFTL
jgi:hypothetical protein